MNNFEQQPPQIQSIINTLNRLIIMSFVNFGNISNFGNTYILNNPKSRNILVDQI